MRKFWQWLHDKLTFEFADKTTMNRVTLKVSNADMRKKIEEADLEVCAENANIGLFVIVMMFIN